MAVVSPSSVEILDPKFELTSENPNPNPNPNPDPSSSSSSSVNHNPNPNPNLVAPPPPSFAPSFRPLGAPTMPQYPTIPNPNPNFGQNPNPSMQPPGVSAPVTYMIPGVASGGGSITVSAPPTRYPPPNAPLMAYGQVPNGYMAVPPPALSW